MTAAPAPAATTTAAEEESTTTAMTTEPGATHDRQLVRPTRNTSWRGAACAGWGGGDEPSGEKGWWWGGWVWGCAKCSYKFNTNTHSPPPITVTASHTSASPESLKPSPTGKLHKNSKSLSHTNVHNRPGDHQWGKPGGGKKKTHTLTQSPVSNETRTQPGCPLWAGRTRECAATECFVCVRPPTTTITRAGPAPAGTGARWTPRGRGRT